MPWLGKIIVAAPASRTKGPVRQSLEVCYIRLAGVKIVFSPRAKGYKPGSVAFGRGKAKVLWQ